MKEKIIEWLKNTSIKVLKTMAETALAVIGTSAILSEVDWMYVLSATALSGVATILFNIKSIPTKD